MRIRRQIFLLLLAGASGVSALERPVVKVRFSLAEPVYMEEYSPEERSRIESMTAETLLKKLEQEIGFLSFSQSGSANYTLTFQLGTPQASRTAFHEVGFAITMTGPDGVSATMRWPFRDRNAWGTSTGALQQFRTEIESKLGKRALSDLVPEVLSMVPVAREGILLRDPVIELAWLLPFKQADLCMDLGSQLKVATEIDSALGTVSSRLLVKAWMAYNPPGQVAKEELRFRIVCIPMPDQSDLEFLKRSQPDAVHVKEIFVMDYRRMRTGCGSPVSPAEIAASFGGER